MTRTCGRCSACCRWPEVSEINKPPRVPCQNLERQGYRCKIYETRPEMCAKYNCAWLRGMGAKKDRPNLSGMLIDRRSTQFGVCLVAKAVIPGAVFSRKGQRAIERTAKDEKMPCLTVDDNGRVIAVIGPPDFVAEVKSKGPYVELGDKQDWVNNIIAMATQQGKIYPGLRP